MGTTPDLVMGKITKDLPEWTVVDGVKIERTFKFKDFKSALKFVNDVGAIAESMNHHPNIYLYGWNKVKLTLTTFATKGLSGNDYLEAVKINGIYAQTSGPSGAGQ